MWKYIGEGRSIAGVPMADMTDEEFAAAEEAYDVDFSPEQAGSLKKCGLYKRVPDPKEKAPEEGG